ncbi:hypothetical protein H4R20_002614 [Coemansia guatemalensis]|uniref:Retrotransposon gag domain-containing protein n=1 Tax=Coemansia guatemalensis TaxID=2761395 RepID=A0A9W8LTT2_9FUNG|nr:hypothetical protein H4R20_002614 [Coemansia guatemalensis]
MAENAGREAAQFAQSVRGHPRFDGNASTITVDGFKEIMESVFRAQSIIDPVRQAVLAEGMLEYRVLQSWTSHCRVHNRLGTATMDQLIAFLTESYDSISSAFQALDELQALTFAVADDLPSFNQKFDHLVARAELPATPAVLTLNHYRRAMPMEIKKELFASDIGMVQQAKTRALVIWRTRKSLQDKPVDDDGPAPMEVDRADNRFIRRRGPRYNARNFPCSEAEFESRLKSNLCLYCGGSSHRYSRCRFRNADSGRQAVQAREIVAEEQTTSGDTDQGNAQ